MELAPSNGWLESPGGARLKAVAFDDLPGFAQDDHLAAFAAFLRSARSIVAYGPELRSALPAPDALRAVCTEALSGTITSAGQARQFSRRSSFPAPS